MKLVNWTWAFTNAVMLVHNPADWLWKRKGMEKEGMDNIDWLVYELRDDNTMVSLFHRLQDIQIRGVNRDQNKIQKANQFPNSKHFFTYRHSLRVSFRCTYAFVPDSFFYILWSSYSSCVPINILWSSYSSYSVKQLFPWQHACKDQIPHAWLYLLLSI